MPDECAACAAYHTEDCCPRAYPETPAGFIAYCHALGREELQWALDGREPVGTDTRALKEAE